MDWNQFFEETRRAAKAESMAKLAPMLGISDGAISHYRTGKRVPAVWTVADCLRLQGHASPDKAAVEIMRKLATSQPEKAFWRRLAASAAAVMLIVTATLPAATPANAAQGASERAYDVGIMRIIGRGLSLLWLWLRWTLSTPRRPAPDNLEAFAC